MSIVDSLKKLAVKLGRAQTPEEIYAPDITTALKQVAVGYGVADDPSKVPGSSIDDVIDLLADKIEPGGGGIPFPEVTVTLNIDHPESVAEVTLYNIFERIGNRFKRYHKDYTHGETSVQSIITGGLLPVSDVNEGGTFVNAYAFNPNDSDISSIEADKYFNLTVSDAVNMRDIEGGGWLFEVIDPSKPVSFTLTATRMTSQ